MIVKIHPHRTKVLAGHPQCVSVTPVGGRAYYKGCVLLWDATFKIHASGVARARAERRRNVHAWCVGTLMGELDKVLTHEEMTKSFMPMSQVTYHYEVGRFITLDGVDVTEKKFSVAICNGRDFYVSVDFAGNID